MKNPLIKNTGYIKLNFQDAEVRPTSTTGKEVCVFDFDEDPTAGDPIIASSCTYNGATNSLTIVAP